MCSQEANRHETEINYLEKNDVELNKLKKNHKEFIKDNILILK